MDLKSRKIFNYTITSFFLAFYLVFSVLLSIFLVSNITNFENQFSEDTKNYILTGIANENIYSTYTDSEMIHLFEVRQLYKKFLNLFKFSIIILFCFILFFYNLKNFKINFRKTAVFYAIFFFILIFFMLYNYDFLFILFHEFLFTEAYNFPVNSLLIMQFPYNFWFNKVIEVFIFALILNVALLIYFWKVKK